MSAASPAQLQAGPHPRLELARLLERRLAGRRDLVEPPRQPRPLGAAGHLGFARVALADQPLERGVDGADGRAPAGAASRSPRGRACRRPRPPAAPPPGGPPARIRRDTRHVPCLDFYKIEIILSNRARANLARMSTFLRCCRARRAALLAGRAGAGRPGAADSSAARDRLVVSAAWLAQHVERSRSRAAARRHQGDLRRRAHRRTPATSTLRDARRRRRHRHEPDARDAPARRPARSPRRARHLRSLARRRLPVRRPVDASPRA